MKYSSMRSPTTNILEFQLKFTPDAAPAAPTATTGADTTSHTPSRTTKGSDGPYNKWLIEKEKGKNQIGNKTNSSDLNHYNSDKRINQWLTQHNELKKPLRG